MPIYKIEMKENSLSQYLEEFKLSYGKEFKDRRLEKKFEDIFLRL